MSTFLADVSYLTVKQDQKMYLDQSLQLLEIEDSIKAR